MVSYSQNFLLPGWYISPIFPVICHAFLDTKQNPMAVVLWSESSQWLVLPFGLFARDWETGFILYLQWAVAKTSVGGSLACKSHCKSHTDNLVRVFGVKLVSQQRPGLWFPLSAACGRLLSSSRPTVLGDNTVSGTMSGLNWDSNWNCKKCLVYVIDKNYWVVLLEGSWITESLIQTLWRN